MGHALKPDCAIKPRSDGLIHVSIAHLFLPPLPIYGALRSWPKKREELCLKSIGKHGRGARGVSHDGRKWAAS